MATKILKLYQYRVHILHELKENDTRKGFSVSDTLNNYLMGNIC